MLCSVPLSALALTAGVQAALPFKGADWSSVYVEEAKGIKYKNVNGQEQSLEQILKASGVNTVRQRVWVKNGDYDWTYNINLAKRAKAAGLGVYLTMHYSDTWADPAHQAIPGGWPTDIENLSWKLYNYTKDFSNALASNGIAPTIISIGNEITQGLLFPTGKTNNWANIAKLLNSAAYGIKDSSLNPKPRIMIHLDNGWNWDTQKWFYDNLLKQNTLKLSDFDVMGVSYYPFYNEKATLAALKSSLTNMANTYGKQIMVAETNWPTSCPSPKYPFPSDLKSIPFSADGQVTFVKQVASVVAGVKNGNGLFYWEPAWVDNQALGSSCSSNTMFSYPGNALKSLSVFSSI